MAGIIRLYGFKSLVISSGTGSAHGVYFSDKFAVSPLFDLLAYVINHLFSSVTQEETN